MEHVEHAGNGNTINVPLNACALDKKKYRAYAFTYYNYDTSTREQLEQQFTRRDAKYVMGYEICPTTNRPHIQGYVRFQNPISFLSMRKLMPHQHLEPARKGDEANLDYCNKDKDYVTNIVIEKVFTFELRGWQSELHAELMQPPDRRKVVWYKDPVGGMGKTEFCRYMVTHHDALVLGGNAADMKNMVYKYWLEKEKPANMPPLLIDLTRSHAATLSYSGVESIKNGLFFNSKYETGMANFNPPHVVIFANSAPIMEKLSQDRWDVREAASPSGAKGVLSLTRGLRPQTPVTGGSREEWSTPMEPEWDDYAI